MAMAEEAAAALEAERQEATRWDLWLGLCHAHAAS